MNLFEDYFLNVIKKHYADYEGRASRSEYWYFTLFVVVGFVAISIVTTILGNMLRTGIFGILGVLFMLALAVPSICLGIKRMHDIGKSGLWLLVGLIPLVGPFVQIYFLVQDSEADRNQYGPNPKRGAVA